MRGYVESVLVVACIYSLVTLGLQVTISSGQFSVMHAALMGVGGYASGVVSVQYHLPFLVALSAGALVAGALGVVVAVMLRRTSGLLLGIVTVALGQSLSLIAENVAPLGGSQGCTGIPLETTLVSAAAALAVGLGVTVVISRVSSATRCWRLVRTRPSRAP